MKEKLEANQIAIGGDGWTICPHCYRPIRDCSMLPEKNTRAGYLTRTYYAWCESCKSGSEVVQFKTKGCERWHIHKFRQYEYELNGDKPIAKEGWVIVQGLPQPPLVMTGPGGEFDEPISGGKTIIDAVKALSNSLAAAKNVADNLIRLLSATPDKDIRGQAEDAEDKN